MSSPVRSRVLSLFPLLALVPAARAQWKSADGRMHEPSGEAVLLQAPEDGLRATLAQLDGVDWSGWQELSLLLSEICRRTGIPALAAAYVADGRIVARAAVGVERFGSDTPITPEAVFHLGSLTKSITACVLGGLVEQGRITWSTRVADVLDDVPMHPAYRDVTLEQLLQHRGGLHAHTDAPPPGMPALVLTGGTPTQKRAAFLSATLGLAPAAPVGETLYSNAGITLAGAMAERVTGLSWEELVRRIVFEPLGMHAAGFGIPASPSGHAGQAPPFRPVPPEAYPPLEQVAPAGNVHCSVADLARYALAHLAGLGGRDGFLRSETVKRLHTAAGPSGGGYASGWMLASDPSGEPVHWHGGTVGAAYAEVRLYPASLTGVVVLTTVEGGLGEAVASRLTRALRERYASSAPGFVTDGRATVSIEPVEEAVGAADDARFWRVIEGLARALNDEDRQAYRALFAASYPAESRDSAFDFMARNVLPKRGGIRSFHAPSQPFRVAGSERTTRVVTFHLDNGFPGYLGIALDDHEKVVEFSLFVKGDLCPSGTDRHCPAIERELDEGR